jgi:drug/metabolite transporter (DMT)-like permease
MYELLIFLAAIVTGTCCSICSKTMMQLHSTGITGETEVFTKPLFQTLGMFVGMMFGLVMHVLVLVFRIPFPGYQHTITTHHPPTVLPVTSPQYGAANNNHHTEATRLLNDKNSGPTSTTVNINNNTVPIWMYFFLAIPSIFDLAATALCMMGLRYLDVSIYQLLRGSGIIFVALMKQHVLKDHLYSFQWVGVLWNVVSVLFVGTAAVLNSSYDDPTSTSSKTAELYGGPEALLGILLVMAGAFVQALQFVFEEKVMAMDDSAAPPLLLIGMEGLWGTFLCIFVVYPLAYYLPGDDHGSYEDPFNTYAMFMASSTIQWAFFVYFFAIFAYNLFAVLVTFSLNSIWHAILDNFRPITVWGTDMFIFYAITSLQGEFGEPWTIYSWVQLLGMFILLYGTAIYNAPNAGSIFLRGQWYSCGINLDHEYTQIEHEEREAAMDHEFEERKLTKRRASSFAEHSPFLTMKTQVLSVGEPR